MKKEDIKLECEDIYAQNEKNQERLDKIRKGCKHEKTFKGLYSWRVGCIQDADICEYCGELVRYRE